MPAPLLFPLRIGLAAAVMSVAIGSAARADFVNTTADPFLGAAVTLTSDTPLEIGTFGYAEQFIIDTFRQSSAPAFAGGNDYVDYTAIFQATLYTDASLITVAQTILLSGTFAATIQGRTSATQTGTFTETITDATFSGYVGAEDPANEVTNSLQSSFDTSSTISQGPGGTYVVSHASGASVPAMMQLGINPIVGPFSLTPTYTLDISEPTSLVLLGVSLTGLSVLRRRPTAALRAA